MTRDRSRLVRESAREMFVVVVSILIAFGLDAWWDSHLERRQEERLLTNLLAEFEATAPQLDVRIANHRRVMDGANAVAGLLSRADGAPVPVPDSLLLALFVTPTFDPALGTLDEAQSSGRTGIIRNAELRALLGGWPGRFRDAREEERLAQEIAQTEFNPALGRFVYFADLMDSGGIWLSGNLPDGALSGDRRLPATPAAANYAKVRAARSRRAVIELEDLRAHLASIIEQLEAELGTD